jgi:hypothetical protein
LPRGIFTARIIDSFSELREPVAVRMSLAWTGTTGRVISMSCQRVNWLRDGFARFY